MRLHLILAALLGVASPIAPDAPLVLSDLVTGPASHVTVTNRAHQPVTAWSIGVTAQKPQGGLHREVYTTEGYLSEVTHGLPRAAERLERLMPGETRELPLDPVPDGAKADVIAVVMDDGTATGEEAAVAAIFANRVKERDALKSVVDAFDAVLPAKHGAAALDDLKDRLAALVARNDNVPCHAALDAVQAYAKKGEADRIDQSLRTYADFVSKEHALAVKHAQRRTANASRQR
jgi:hypothetical protein